MAYMNQDKKRIIASNLKQVLKDYRLKYTLSVSNHSAIVMTITEGNIPFFDEYIGSKDKPAHGDLEVNPYWFNDHFIGRSKFVLNQIVGALKSANWYDKSDAQIDYFNTAYYFYIRIGRYDKPYKYTGKEVTPEEFFKDHFQFVRIG